MQNTELAYFPKEKRNVLIIFIGVIIILNYFLSLLNPSDAAVHIDGTIATANEIKSSIFKSLFISIPVIGFMLGFFFSFIPYKKLKYWKKYLPVSLVTILGINLIFFLLGIISLFMK